MNQIKPQKRGAPIGSKNARKHGMRDAAAMEAMRARGAFYRMCRETIMLVKEACDAPKMQTARE